MRSFYTFFVQTLLLLSISLVSATMLNAQESRFKDGVQQGVVKVKFKSSMATTLNKMQVQTRGNVLSTGISNLDRAAKTLKATNMERLFPYNAKTESKLKKHGLDLWYVMRIDQDMDARSAVRTLEGLSEVAVVECSYEKTVGPLTIKPYTKNVSQKRIAMPFNDPYMEDQWHYTNQGQTGFENGADVNLYDAWKRSGGRSDIIVSIHDDGLDVNHEDIKDNMWINYAELNGVEGADDDGNGYIDDIYGYNFVDGSPIIAQGGHGTHVAGTVGAVNDNGIGVAGVAGGTGKGDGVKLMALQVVGNNSLIERSYVYAADNGAVISQNSWGYTVAGAVEQAVLEAIDYFIAEAGNYPNSPMKGGIVIFASGNSDSSGPWYPGYYESTFSVSALGPDWKKASYSNYGDWVEISAPGGDQDVHGVANGILSTYPDNQYSYMSGTSMACPHVSGIAALVLANSDKQLTNKDLWDRLITGVREIDEDNPNYKGLLGVGAIDADLATRVDLEIAPEKITDFKLMGIAPEFAQFNWTVPDDEDDKQPLYFKVYYSTQAITAEIIKDTPFEKVTNKQDAGTQFSFILKKLEANTKYWFTVTSADRWGHESLLSNIEVGTTNNHPKIDVETGNDDKSILQNIIISNSPLATSTFDLLNNGLGALSWSHIIRTLELNPSYDEFSRVKYPAVKKSNKANKLRRIPIKENEVFKGTKSNTFAYYPERRMQYYDLEGDYISQEEPDTPLSSATKFVVEEEDGFNLTHVEVHLRYKANTEPMIVEIYKGDDINNMVLVSSQEYTATWGNVKWNETIQLREPLFFEKGEVFWLVYHVAPSSQGPMKQGVTPSDLYQNYCYFSGDYGKTWESLSEALNYPYAVWSVAALSKMAPVDKFFELDPMSGTVMGNGKQKLTVNTDATNAINGTYKANIVLMSNDPENPEYRVPMEIDVTGQKPHLVYPKIVEVGSVFIGASKSVDIEIENDGYGLIKDLTCNISNPEFTLSTNYMSIDAKSKSVITVTYTPTTAGGASGLLTVANGNHSYDISLMGVAVETSTIKVSPSDQTMIVPNIGDKASAEFTIENLGKYPLKYFVPGYDQEGIGETWPEKYHKYGYSIRSNKATSNPLVYDFNDISKTGINITKEITDKKHATIKLGFKFPFYNTLQSELYVVNGGYISFDNTITFPGSPNPNQEIGPRGYISLFGDPISYNPAKSGTFYKAEYDRLTIQWEEVFNDGMDLPENIYTAQMVLFYNGDIRFYYKKAPTSSWPSSRFAVVFIEDVDREDALIIKDNTAGADTDEEAQLLKAGDAFGFDYPGPAIVESIENGSGILHPGKSKLMKVNMDTKTLSEGETKRYINIINNDPENARVSALVNLKVENGGIPQAKISDEKLDFGIIYKDFSYTSNFKISNEGTKDIAVVDFVFSNNKFSIAGDKNLKAGLTQEYIITALTDVAGNFDDVLTINYSDGSKQTVSLKSNVLLAPIVSADETVLAETLNLGEKKSHPYTITNTGGSDLDINIVGATWANLKLDEASKTMFTAYDYVWEHHIEGQPTYNWIDISKTGTHVEDLLVEDPYLAWSWLGIDLPFIFKYYGQDYSKLKITGNGIVSFDDNPRSQMMPPNKFPIEDNGKYIMPFWFSAVVSPSMDEEITGLFYQSFNSRDKTDTDVTDHDMLVLSWDNMIVSSGVGNTLSFQLIMYKNGNMHFQYKVMDESQYDNISHNAMVGFQNGGEQYKAISEKNRIDFGSNALSYFITPSNQYKVPAGNKLTGKLTFDSTPIYAGVFEDSLKIHSNEPEAELRIKKLKLTVNGEAKTAIEEEIDFGRVKMGLDGDDLSYYMDVPIVNTGDAILEITKIERDNFDFGGEVLYKDKNSTGFEWTSIVALYGPMGSNPTLSVKPGEKLVLKVSYTPYEAIAHEGQLTITTNAGTFTVDIKASAYQSAIMELDKKKIEATATTKEIITDVVTVKNSGDYKLEYETSVKYVRTSTTKVAKTIEQETEAVAQLPIRLTEKPNSAITYANKNARADVFRKRVSHTGVDTPTHFEGLTGGVAKDMNATRYTAGPEGFNLSDIFTYFRAENTKEGIIEVEIRAGNADIQKAISLGRGSIWYNNEKEDINGAWYQITLKESINIYPNEDFFVILSYPAPLIFPQGVAQREDVENVANRYLTQFEGRWYDVQEAVPQDFTNTGWSMAVAERSEPEIAWLRIKSHSTGTIEVDNAVQMEVEIIPEAANQGSQSAYISFTSNDRIVPSTRVQVTLRTNEAPVFANAPSSIYVLETEKHEVEITVSDAENNKFEVEAVNLPKFTTFSYDETKATITLTSKPKIGDKGAYSIVIKATDELGASKVLEIPVQVNNINKAPVYIGDINEIALSIGNGPQQFNLLDLFEDPDGDEMNFVIESANDDILSVYHGATSIFTIEGLKEGTTKLKFVVTDVYNAVTNKEIAVTVSSCIDPHGIVFQKWNSVLLVDNSRNQHKTTGYQWYKNGLPLKGETKQYYSTEELDFTAEYHVQVPTKDGAIFFTCPMIPEYKNNGLKVYPNPVEAGQAVTIEANVDNIENDPMDVQLTNINGNTVKTFSVNSNHTTFEAPAAAGVYVITFNTKGISASYRLMVK